jgi:putative transferase (TIGR04331 family)
VSPWLSERKKYWKDLKYKSNNKFDILLSPTRLIKFQSQPRSDINGVDDVFNNSRNLINMVDILTNSGLSILYKTPSISSLESYRESIKIMHENANGKFEIVKNIDKGLTLELLNNVGMVVWDVLGTGFLECISCKIPTILYISNYLVFEDFIVPYLSELEDVQIIHRDPSTMVKAVESFNRNPYDWMTNTRRVYAVNRFVEMFCNTSPNWKSEFLSYIKSMHV